MKIPSRSFKFFDPSGISYEVLAPRPEQVRAYLEAHGWRARQVRADATVFVKRGGRITCPSIYTAPAYTERLAELVEFLGKHEKRPCKTIVRAIHRARPAADDRQTSLLPDANRGAA